MGQRRGCRSRSHRAQPVGVGTEKESRSQNSYDRNSAPWAALQAATIRSRTASASPAVNVPSFERKEMLSNRLFLPGGSRCGSRYVSR